MQQKETIIHGPLYHDAYNVLEWELSLYIQM